LGAAVAVTVVILVVVALGRSDPGGTTTTLAGATTTTTQPTTTTPTAPETTTTAATTTTTESTTTTTQPTTTTTTDPFAEVTLEPDGLGPVGFGATFEETVSALAPFLGEADADTDWIDSFSPFGTCPGSEIRVVRWQSLEVFFTDGATDWGPEGRRHFFTYSQSALLGDDVDVLPLRTPEGVGVGSTVADVAAIYGEDAVGDDPVFGPYLLVDFPGAGILRGVLSGTSPNDTVLAVSGGEGCGE
jgi:hypothetical protein